MQSLSSITPGGDAAIDLMKRLLAVADEIDATQVRFEPGDVITTGAPPGVGFARVPPVFLRDGDELSISATGVGTLTNPVVASGGAL